MKKFLPYILIVVVLVGLFSLAKNVQAQGSTTGEPRGRCSVSYTNVEESTYYENVTYAQCQAYDTGSSVSALWVEVKPTGEVGEVKVAQGSGGNWWDILIPAKWIAGALGWIAIAILKIASYLTYLGGVVLNYVVQYTVVDMKIHLEEASTVNRAWTVIRDIANMGFIFVLLYAAINTIIGRGEDNQKLIVKIVVVAILINFSLFFTKVVIDASNVLAVTFYDAIAPGALADNINSGISNNMMRPLGVQSIWKVATNFEGEQLLIIGVMGSIVSLIAAFVFFAVAIMFVIRFVVLIFVLILSPIAFVSSALPGLGGQGKKWWDALSGQAFFAPIYFLLTWIVIEVANSLPTNALVNPESWHTAFAGAAQVGGSLSPTTSSIGLMVNFIIVIALLIASLMIAKDWANKAGPGVTSMTKWAMGAAGGATLGVGGRFGRGTIGRAGQAIAENEWLKDKAPTSRLARLGLAASRKTAGASFDVRGSAIGGTLEAGKAQKGGFAKDLEDKTKAEKKYADSLKPSNIVLAKAERKFEEIKKTGTIQEVAEAQKELDELKGASAEDLRNRKIKELVASGKATDKKDAKRQIDVLENRRLLRMNELRNTMSEEAAKAQIKTEREDVAGLEFEAVKSLENKRKESYAKDKETSTTISVPIPMTEKKIPFSLTGRVGFIGRVKRERLEEAITIRKSIKEKKPAEKIAEEIKTQSEAAADENTGPEPTAPATPPAEGTPSTP